MKVHIEFEHNWTLKEIKDFLHNMTAEKYVSLSDSEYLELTACAERYLKASFYNDEGITSRCINDMAMEDIKDGIEDYIAEYAEENYTTYYHDVIREYLLEACKNLPE